MDKRFRNLFNLTEEEAIALLNTPQDQVREDDSRYIAASHLANFPTEASINALLGAVQNSDPSLDNRIVRRESVKSLGKLQTNLALPAIQTCLADDDCYTVETAVWAIGEIGTQEPQILEEIAQLLEKPGQIYRVIIHTLAKLDYKPALERIRKFVDADDKPIASAAMSAVYRFTGDSGLMEKVVALLQHPNVNARRGCIQDLIDSQYYAAIPFIARCPVSLVFRLRGIRLMAEVGIPAGKITFEDIQPSLEQVLRDHPHHLDLVHCYDQTPTLEFLIRELYQTDFGRCYLATKTLLEVYPDEAPEALLATYAEEAYNDYGAHYHVMKLFGWLKYAAAYDLLIEALHNRQPQFQKSRAAAAIALGELGDSRAIDALKSCLETKIWDLKYTALMALEKLGDTSSHKIAANDPDWLIRLNFASKI
ncbi:HEAT repeat domain-containing protein [Microseira sp. BLCC-F43]|jgi:bilin biosynthesis protein|uniref:HEAT repeat domain-containing protein n=1 Tax=Microseira sp. BLCC-F43 TaxID=3153602 RepID=UPI0035B80836